MKFAGNLAVLEVTTWSDTTNGDREIMAVAHRSELLYGLQFHPESFLTHVRMDIPAQVYGSLLIAQRRISSRPDHKWRMTNDKWQKQQEARRPNKR